MRILGLNHDMFISSAALVEDGTVIAAVAEERLTRDKRTRAFPRKSIAYCLKEAGIKIEDVDAIATSWNPGAYFRKFNPLVSNKRRHMAEHLFAVPDHLIDMFPQGDHTAPWLELRIPIMGHTCRVFYVTHHSAHAANAYHLSPFEDAAILTADSQGEYESTTFQHGRGSKIDKLRSIDFPQSLGAFYATFTEFLGFRPNSDEWKVMALGAYEKGHNPYDDILEEVVSLDQDGGYTFDLAFFQGFMPDKLNLYTPHLIAHFGEARQADEELCQRHFQIAGAVQRRAEKLAFHMMRQLQKETGSKNLCVAGGFFMNSLLNGKIRENTPFEKVFISSCPDDSGNAIGAALYAMNDILGNDTRVPQTHNYFGPAYGNTEIADAIEKYGLKAEPCENIAEACAQLLAEGSLIGWFQGRMELGQRALGCRSILADPRQASTRDQVNLAVKYREKFRPFAPAILKEEAPKWFNIDSDVEVPFMEQVHMVRPEKRDAIPACVHADGTGRLQTVDAETNLLFHQLISAFDKKTGVPVLLNTSFNLNGEPVVSNPTDAIRTFFSCGLDVLAMGNYLIKKNG